jgi:Pyruvate/2-oxoacid:ferredoxin oxidoreductase gamma subunit
VNFIKDIYIDISGKPDTGALIYSKQGDGGLYYVRVHIMDGDIEVVLDPTVVHIALSTKKPDGTVVLDDSKTTPDNICINEDGTVTILLTPTLQSVSGLERIEIIILDADNNQITTAFQPYLS